MLVIIGLIVGGILVGQDLIRAAEVRAQITQIEKFNSAVNTFRGKYSAIPGDMNLATAEQFGFAVGTDCNGLQGQRDGNGLIDGWYAPYTLLQGAGETAMFWQDLTSNNLGENLIEGSFPNGGASSSGCGPITALTSTSAGELFPEAKIGRGNFVYVYEVNSENYFGISTIISVPTVSGALESSSTIPVVQAYNIDKKTDDGLPATGKITAAYINGSNEVTSVAPNAVYDNSSTCYNTSSGTYSIDYKGGAGANCALSFQFQ